MPSVTVRNMSVSYNKGKSMALSNLDLNIEDGEFCVFLGPSGCGKTTALQCIAGLLNPSTGEIAIGNTIATSVEKGQFVRPQERNIAMVFQEYALYPNMTVRGNLSFALETMGVPKAEIKSRVEKTAQMLGIEQLLDRKPAQLSGGQRQRVALGRALVRDPQVFLLDEPLGNLDQKLREQVRFELKRLQRQLGVTTIYVTHDQTEAMTLADRIVLMKDGQVVQQGSARDLYMRPKNLFVAGFVGSPAINIVNATIAKHDDYLVFRMSDFTLPVPRNIAARYGDQLGKKFTLGIRPSDFNRAETINSYTIKAKVEVVEPLGDAALLHAAIGDFLITAKLEEAGPEEVGRQIALSVDPERIHVFDYESGDRVE